MGWHLRKARATGRERGTTVLSDEEMAAVEMLVRYKLGEPQDQSNVLFRAWQKLVVITVPKA